MKEEFKTFLQLVVPNIPMTHVNVHVLLMIIDKFDPNPVLVNINKLKPYRFVEDHTIQPILAKPSDFLPIESIETSYSGNLFIKEPIETNHFGNLFTEELVESHIRDMTVSKPVKKRTDYNLSNQEPIEKVHVSLILVQTNDVLINLVKNVSFLKKFCPKGCNFFQTPPFLTPWM
jgi:hypothetical protein